MSRDVNPVGQRDVSSGHERRSQASAQALAWLREPGTLVQRLVLAEMLAPPRALRRRSRWLRRG